eukprot:5787175-Pleurochrysis_carterae.AAC.2
MMWINACLRLVSTSCVSAPCGRMRAPEASNGHGDRLTCLACGSSERNADVQRVRSESMAMLFSRSAPELRSAWREHVRASIRSRPMPAAPSSSPGDCSKKGNSSGRSHAPRVTSAANASSAA